MAFVTESSRSLGKSLKSLERRSKEAASRAAVLSEDHQSLLAEVKAAATQLAIVTEETRRQAESAKAALERERALVERIESTSQRIDRTKTIVAQLSAARGASQQKTERLGQTVDYPPESNLADSIAQLWSDLQLEG